MNLISIQNNFIKADNVLEADTDSRAVMFAERLHRPAEQRHYAAA